MAIDAASEAGFTVILSYWEGNSSRDGIVDNTTTWTAMWRGRVILSGTGYNQWVTSLGADSRFTGTLAAAGVCRMLGGHSRFVGRLRVALYVACRGTLSAILAT